MSEAVDNIMALAAVMAMKRVRRFAVLQPNYRGPESEEGSLEQLKRATANLRTAVEALAKDSANAAFDSVAKSFDRQCPK